MRYVPASASTVTCFPLRVGRRAHGGPPPRRAAVRGERRQHDALGRPRAAEGVGAPLGQRRPEGWGYIPCGCEVHAGRTFGDLILPSEFSVGWWFGTPRYAPFFHAALTAAEAG